MEALSEEKEEEEGEEKRGGEGAGAVGMPSLMVAKGFDRFVRVLLLGLAAKLRVKNGCAKRGD